MTRSVDQPPAARIVLLGASNLTRGFRVALEAALGGRRRPADVLVAMGHGRSYGQAHCILGRTLPGITQCVLWQALRSRPPAPLYALLTDMGNDLFYGETPSKTVQWVARCLDRLDRAGAATALALPPACNLPRLSPARYRILVRVLFPLSRIGYGEAVEGAYELHARLVELAAARGIATIDPIAAWYGWDPIHVRRRSSQAVWKKNFSAWPPPSPARQQSSAARLGRLQALRLRPARYWLCGLPCYRAQPCCRLADGTTLSLY